MKVVLASSIPRKAATMAVHPVATAGYPKNSVSAELGLQYGSQKADTTSIVATPDSNRNNRAKMLSRKGFALVHTPSRIPPASGSRRVRVPVHTSDPGRLPSQ